MAAILSIPFAGNPQSVCVCLLDTHLCQRAPHWRWNRRALMQKACTRGFLTLPAVAALIAKVAFWFRNPHFKTLFEVKTRNPSTFFVFFFFLYGPQIFQSNKIANVLKHKKQPKKRENKRLPSRFLLCDGMSGLVLRPPLDRRIVFSLDFGALFFNSKPSIFFFPCIKGTRTKSLCTAQCHIFFHQNRI